MITGVLVDANVLFSRTLRDWLFLLRNETHGGMFTVYATEDIIAEAVYGYRRKHPTAPGSVITRLRDLLAGQLDVRVTDYDIVDTFIGRDENDAHVHAAALASGAQILLSADTGFTDLDEKTADGLAYEVHTPDSFFILVDNADANTVRSVTRQQLDYWYRHDGEVDLAKRLRDAGCPAFASRVNEHILALNWNPPHAD